MIKRLAKKIIRMIRAIPSPPVEDKDFFHPPSPLPPPGLLLQGRTVLVTGAGPIIGGHIAREMALHGATVFFTVMSVDWRNELERDLKSINPDCRGFLADTTEFDASIRVLDAIGSKNRHVDILVNNAARFDFTRRFEEKDLQELERLYKVNVFGPLSLTQHVVRRLISIKRPGSILFLTSIHQFTLGKLWLAYTSSMAALGMVVRDLAMDLARHSIRVNGIAPGYCTAGRKPHKLPCHRTPLGKEPVHPRLIGRNAVFLSSDHYSHHTTGTILTIDGGLSLHSYFSNLEMSRQ